MRRRKKNVTLEGFEDYEVCIMSDTVFDTEYYPLSAWHFSHSFDHWDTFNFVLYDKDDKRLPNFDNRESFKSSFPETGELTGAEKVYVHPNCKLSRTLVYQKYKKCLSPLSADVVVVPNPIESICTVWYNTLLTVSDNVVHLCHLSDDFLNKIVPGKTVGECANYNSWQYDSNPLISYEDKCKVKMSCNSVIDGVYTMVLYSQNTEWVKNYIDGTIPKDRIVWEQTMQKSLGTENNKVTVESLQSIVEMLKSSDTATQSTGLKALSVMDWANYPGSVRYAINEGLLQGNNLICNPAWDSTSVKYMKKQLKNAYSRKYPFSLGYQKTITKEDWNVLKPLVEKTGGWNIVFLNNCGFLRLDKSGKLEIVEREGQYEEAD